MMQFQQYLIKHKDVLNKVVLRDRKSTKDTVDDTDVDIVYDDNKDENDNNDEDGNDHETVVELRDVNGKKIKHILSLNINVNDDITNPQTMEQVKTASVDTPDSYYINTKYSPDMVETPCENQNERLLLVDFKKYVPRSWIVHKDEGKEQNLIIAKEKAYELYNKYISESSPYEINVSYQLRARFMDIMEDHDLWIMGSPSPSLAPRTPTAGGNIDDIVENIDAEKLAVLFNMVLVEMFQLLEFSFSRFKSMLKDGQNKTVINLVGSTQV